jgi:hypothetical protein
VRVLRELVRDSLYVVPEQAVAEAIILRARTKLTMPDQTFRSAQRDPERRSFRRDSRARSFRLSGSSSPRRTHHY